MADRPDNPPLRGDETALFEQHHATLLRVTRRACRGATRELIEDACSEAWTQLIRCQPDREHVFSWLCLVAKYRAWNFAKRARRDVDLDAVLEPEASAGDPADALLAKETIEQLLALPPRQRHMLLLSAAGHPRADIARRCDVSISSVSSRISDARWNLKRPAPDAD